MTVARFYLSAPGLVCPLGSDPQTICQALFAGQHGLTEAHGWLPDRAVWLGQVDAELPAIAPALAAFDCRNNRLLLAALQQLQPTLAPLLQRYPAERIGVVIGSSTSGIAEGERAIAEYEQRGQFPAGFAYRQQEIGAPALFVARQLGVRGPAYTVSTACTSSTRAMMSARQLLQADMCDAVIVGGADSLCRLTVQGFAALESFSRGQCRPFSADRDGINIGEGAALFVLSREPGPVALVGAGASADAYHISAPQPDGLGAEQAMRAALQDAGLTPAAIDYLNLHGTATAKNDEMEARAVHRLFGAALPCSSTKALTGHLLGAAGAVELAFCYFALQQQQLPVQLRPPVSDPNLPALNLVTQPAAARLATAMSCNYAFGGSNVALVLARTDAGERQ
ncbi:beta-ketoacyl-ACP synthase [Permianibacter sp. IMCC34836]|uniref:beta-ketoacyl-ACP synthase n=1 Tax=Permianibacter fluminis TaxID=2738515 RepID=UPI0015567C44|nr:beta-ketoacyl-ACP synthase [Permianibacter fluminis]NQD35542.1 beta-ketoacyl-ACP synthase [Permianibacter fluminis]